MIRECVICGMEFNPRGHQKTCGVDCRKYYKKLDQKRRHSEKEKKSLIKKCLVCGSEYRAYPGNRITCGSNCSKYLKNKKAVINTRAWREKNKDRAIQNARDHYERNKELYYSRARKWISENRERHRELSRMSKLRNPETEARRKLKREIGIEPPPDLLEERTALLLLRRAIKKAGE